MSRKSACLGLFVFHLVLAVATARKNRKARGDVGYYDPQSKQSGGIWPGGASGWMFATGFVVLLFLALHLVDFTFERNPLIDYGSAAAKEPFDKAVDILTNPLSAIVYILGCLALGLHLSHGFSSAFQSLGVNHAGWNCCIRCCGYLFAWTVAIGFVSFVFWAWARAV